MPALISRGVLAHLAQTAVQGLAERNPEALREASTSLSGGLPAYLCLWVGLVE